MKKSIIASISAMIVIVIVVAAVGSTTNLGLFTKPNDSQQYEGNQVQSSTMTALEQFSPPTNVTSKDDGYAWTPNIAVDQNSHTMYIAYEKKDADITNLYIKRSDDNGKTFSDPVRVNDKPGAVFLDGRVPPNVKIGPKGEVYVLWVKGDPAPKLFMKALRGLVLAVSTDGAKTFSSAITVADNEPLADRSFHALEVSEDGKIYVGWLESPAKKLNNGTIVADNSIDPTIRFVRSLDGGHTFEHSIAVDKNQCECCNVFLTSDSHNNVYISWRKKFDMPTDMSPGNRTGMASMGGGMSMTLVIRDIVVAHSSDGGQSFSAPVKVHADNFDWNTCLHVGAPMAVDSKGVLHVAWYTGKEGMAGIHYVTSSDQGKTFSSPVPILTGDWVPPSRISLAVDKNDNTWITWEDTSGLAANSVHWKYEDTKARIDAAMVTPDGQVFKRTDPLNQVDGKSPIITFANDDVYVIWGDTDGGIQDSILNTLS